MSKGYTFIVQEIAQKEGICNAKLELESSGNKGDGYLGKIQFGKIVGSNKTLDVVFKRSHCEDKGFGDLIHDVYMNETFFYDTVVPAFKSFQEEHNISDPYDNYAKFYGSIKTLHEETLILENLKSCGFKMWDRKKLMDEEHLKCAMRTFAKFHGTSFALQQWNPKLYKKLTDGVCKDVFFKLVDAMKFPTQLQSVIKDLNKKIFSAPKDKVYYDKLEDVAATVAENLQATLLYNDHTVIVQGDCWCTNALYEYSSTNREVPKSMKMLDLQLMHIGSPVLDLSYFFYAAASKECFSDLNIFLKVYHDALAEHLAKFGLQADDVFSFDELCKHWKDLSKFGIYLTLLVRRVMLVESEDAPDFTEDPEAFLDNLKMTHEAEKKYVQQLQELFIHFIENEFI